MKAWYLISLVTALIPLCFRIRNRLSTTVPAGAVVLATQESRSSWRIALLLLLGGLGVLVLAWAAKPLGELSL